MEKIVVLWHNKVRHDLAISLTVNDKNSRQVSQRDKPNDPAITVKQPRAIHRRRTYMYIYPQKKKPIRQTQSRSSKKIKTFNKTKKRKNAKKKYSSQCWTRWPNITLRKWISRNQPSPSKNLLSFIHSFLLQRNHHHNNNNKRKKYK